MKCLNSIKLSANYTCRLSLKHQFSPFEHFEIIHNLSPKYFSIFKSFYFVTLTQIPQSPQVPPSPPLKLPPTTLPLQISLIFTIFTKTKTNKHTYIFFTGSIPLVCPDYNTIQVGVFNFARPYLDDTKRKIFGAAGAQFFYF